MPAFRRPAPIAVLFAGLVLAAGCQSNGDGEAQPLPPSESSTKLTETSSPSPSETTGPAWQEDYSKKEIAAYEEAFDRFETYQQRSEPIWREGKATPAAEELLREYFPSPVWQNEFGRLEAYEANNLTTSGLATVHWSRVKSISRDALSVDIEQCVDFSDVVTTQDREPVEGNRWTDKPHIRAISMAKPAGYDWLIYSYGDPMGKKRPCSP